MITPSETGSILSDTIADLVVACRVGTGNVHHGRPKDAAEKKPTEASRLCLITK